MKKTKYFLGIIFVLYLHLHLISKYVYMLLAALWEVRKKAEAAKKERELREKGQVSWKYMWWCDLGKPITWCKISNLSYRYYIWKFESSSIQNILWSKVTDDWCQRLSKIKKNIRIMKVISFIWKFHSVRHVTGFSDNITYGIYLIMLHLP